MVGSENLRLQVGIGSFDDIVSAATTFELSIIERIGNNIPTAEMKITLPYELAPYLETEIAEVKIAFGFSDDEMIYSRWQIVGFTEDLGVTTFSLTTDRAYLNDTEYKAYKDDFSVNVMEHVVKKYYSVKDVAGADTFQVKLSADKMTWVHKGNSVRDFVDELWLYSWYGGKTLVIPAITAGMPQASNNKAGTFRLIDLASHENAIDLSTDKAYKKGVVIVTGNLGYRGFSGKYNNAIGNRADNSFNVKDASVICNVIGENGNKLTPVFKGDFNEKPTSDKKTCVKTIKECPIILSDNVHPKFSAARASNLTRLAKFGAYSKRVQVADYDIEAREHRNIIIGDIVNLNIPYIGMDAQNEIHSGYWVVAETVQRITTEGATKAYTKELVLRRDASIVTEYNGLLGTV